MPEPPPVRLIAINDVHLPAASGFERELDGFYIGLLAFVRRPSSDANELLIYDAENQRLCFDVLEPPIGRDTVRPTGIEIRSIPALEQQLIDAQIPHTRQIGLVPGEDSILLQDPAGNWLNVSEMRIVF
jgi:hypothetical protein